MCSVQFSHSVVLDSLQSHGPPHARPPCPSLTPWVHPNPCPLNQWCHPTISSSVVPCSYCPHSFPASGSFQMSQLFPSDGQSIGSFSISPSSEHPGLISFRIDWFDLLAVQGTLKSVLQHHSSKASILLSSAFFLVPLSHPYMTTGKTIALTRWTFVGKVMSCLLICCLEKAMAPHSSTLAWKIPWTEESGRLQTMGSWRVGHDWATSLSLFTFMHWRRKWQPTPVFLPGESQGWGSLVGCCLWGRIELDMAEVT